MLPCIAAWCLVASTRSGPDFVVSPNGNDAWVGSVAKPFRTLDCARDAVRRFRKSHPALHRPVRVLAQSGLYELERPFRLTPEDSGTADSPTEFVGDGAVLSGGREISGFHKDQRGHWVTTVPEVRSGNWRFSQLFVNGSRRFRPRAPSAGYFTIASEVPPTTESKGKGFDRFAFNPGDIDGSWHNLSDVELLCFHTWDMSRMKIGAIDAAANIVTTTGSTGYDAAWATFPKGNRYIAENVKEGLKNPGEWYLDNKTGQLLYIPLKGEKISNTKFEAPHLERLIEIQGNPANHQYVQNVNLTGFSMSYTNWNVPAKGRFFPQAEVDLGAAIQAVGWRKSKLTDCRVSGVGEYGLELSGGCEGIEVRDCEFSDLGAGGIKIGETKLYDDEADAAHNITIQNCLIAHGGRIHPAAIGVWIGQSSHNDISHNDIYDLYYTGISVGWTWGYGKSEAHHNRIAYNHIYDIGQGVLSDMGGIYTLGIQPGTELIGNRIHDIDSFSYGGWGIYPDEGSSHELIEGNTVFRTKSGGFHQHYGEDNTVRNNIFAFAREAEIIRTRAEDHLSFTFENNIVYWKDAPLLGSNWTGNNYKLDNNLYWRTDGKPVDFAGMTLEQWQAKGQDTHSVIADPLFSDPSRGVFSLKAASPAQKLGFKPIDQTQAGRAHTRSAQTDPPFPAPAFPLVKS